MADMLQELLSKTSIGGGASPELLESLGKKASRQFIDGGTALNESITSMASEYPNLENEHIKRIAETANNSTFQELHQREEDKNIHFPLADPGSIIRDLKDGGSPAHDGKTLHTDYQDDGKKDRDLDAFGSAFQEHAESSQVKEASADHQLHINPTEDVFDTHLRLRGAREKIAEAHEQFDLLLKQAEEEFYQACKAEVLDPDNTGLRGVVHAVKLASPNDSIAFQALRKVATRLVNERAITTKDLQKTAAIEMRTINPEHPIISTFMGLVKAATEKVRSKRSLDEIDEAMAKTGSYLKGLR